MAGGACGEADTARPVATIAASVTPVRPAAGGHFDVTYTLALQAGSVIADDYQVFVQGVDGRGGQIWSDDHAPPIATSQWRPGQVISYTRTSFLPVVAYVGPVTIRAGLYRDGVRLPLLGPDPADREITRAYTVASLEALPQSADSFITYGEGWYAREFGSPDPTLTWRWTGRAAVISFENPGVPVEICLDHDVPAANPFPAAQQIRVRVDQRLVASFSADRESRGPRQIPLAPDMLVGDRVEVRIEVEPPFVPARLTGSPDTRELGIRVRHLHVRPAS